MILARHVSRPFLKISDECIYEVPFLDSLRFHLMEPLVIGFSK